MPMKLYGAILSPFVRKTRMVLALKGLEYEPVHVDPNNMSENYQRINPLRRIPALEVDGQVLADSAVICAYLERSHPQPPLYPADDPYQYARTLWFEKYADYELGANCTFAVFRNRIVMPLLGKEGDQQQVDNALNNTLPALFDYLDQELADKEYLAGQRLTVADIALASQLVNFRHAGETVNAARHPNLAAHAQRIHALEPFARTIEKESALIDKLLGR